MNSPFASSFDAYWNAGWRGVLPLPYGKKTWPPEGYTGYAGATPSYPDLCTWADDRPRNVCLRLSENEVGIDVDHYDGKAGGDTLAGLVDKLGALPPTALSTSRDDGISGIRLYRVPPGTVLPTKLPGIEFVQRHHRYVVAWPSVHPSGRVYRWIDERSGQVLDEPPRVADLPDLPQAWIDGLAVEAREHVKADLSAEEAYAILSGLPDGDPCTHVLAHAGKTMAGGDRHDSYNEAVLAVIGSARRGCPGAKPIIARMKAAFVAEVSAGPTARASRGEAEAEWKRSILGAVALVAGEEQGSGCPDDLFWADQASEDSAGSGDSPPEPPNPFDLAVRRKLGDMLVTDAARNALAERKAGLAPPLTGIGLGPFLAEPDEDEPYRIADLWPTPGRVLNPAAAKSGKTTLVLNLLRSLADGALFLGHFRAQPVARRVVYLNLEVSARRMRSWLRDAGIVNADRVTVANLRGRVSALGLNSEMGRRRLADWLRTLDAEIVILDPLAPALAAFGLDENSNSDVAQFFNWWAETLADAGVIDDLICHHAGHAGERSRGASRLLDEPDAIWTITRDAEPDDGMDDVYGGQDARYLRAVGRDVDIPPTALGYDPDTRALTFREGVTRRKVRDEGRRDAVLAYVKDNPGQSRTAIKQAVPGSSDAIWKALQSLIDEGEVILRDHMCHPAH